MQSFDLSPIWVSLKLASVTTALLLALCLPLAWWLSRRQGRHKALILSVSTLPLVLPPSVLGFYFLLLLGANSPLSPAFQLFGIHSLAFTFAGLVIASMLYSLPFVLQPIVNAFDQISDQELEAAATLRSSPLDQFVSIAIPIARPAIVTACILGFAHTMGEFGVILMIGGSIPGETKVLSIAIYEHVEALEYTQAHILSAGMLGFAFVTLLLTHWINARRSSPMADAASVIPRRL